MSRPMDHAAAHERLADLALEPEALARLEDDASLAPLRAHLDGCDACRSDLAAWRETWASVAEATANEDGVGRSPLADVARESAIVSPEALRDRIAAAVAASPALAPASVAPVPALAPIPLHPLRARLASRWRPALALVAALAIVVGGAGVIVDQQRRLEAATAEAAAMREVAVVTDRVLNEKSHWVVSLTSADGSAHGTLAWSSHDIVVTTTALAVPPAGSEYRCWLERNGVRTAIGTMWFAGDLAYWSGSLEDWATTSLDGGGRFGVSLEPIGGSGGGTGAPVLVADLG